MVYGEQSLMSTRARTRTHTNRVERRPELPRLASGLHAVREVDEGEDSALRPRSQVLWHQAGSWTARRVVLLLTFVFPLVKQILKRVSTLKKHTLTTAGNQQIVCLGFEGYSLLLTQDS